MGRARARLAARGGDAAPARLPAAAADGARRRRDRSHRGLVLAERRRGAARRRRCGCGGGGGAPGDAAERAGGRRRGVCARRHRVRARGGVTRLRGRHRREWRAGHRRLPRAEARGAAPVRPHPDGHPDARADGRLGGQAAAHPRAAARLAADLHPRALGKHSRRGPGLLPPLRHGRLHPKVRQRRETGARRALDQAAAARCVCQGRPLARPLAGTL
mmetsp:Transcript_40329/g.130477  ORF Transcript_40329/g.130477 Transcript_40329/m.130477 type:complete len:217 (-) Transcript_40329:121-771(-)